MSPSFRLLITEAEVAWYTCPTPCASNWNLLVAIPSWGIIRQYDISTIMAVMTGTITDTGGYGTEWQWLEHTIFP